LRADLADILEALRLGEVSAEDGEAVWVLLDLPRDAHTRALEPEVEAADTREEAADIHDLPLGRLLPAPSKIGT
jgi:hypothetical protein